MALCSQVIWDYLQSIAGRPTGRSLQPFTNAVCETDASRSGHSPSRKGGAQRRDGSHSTVPVIRTGRESVRPLQFYGAMVVVVVGVENFQPLQTNGTQTPVPSGHSIWKGGACLREPGL